MKPAGFGRDILADYHDKMKSLVDMTLPPEVEGEEIQTKKSGKKGSGDKGSVDIGSFFRFYSNDNVKGRYGGPHQKMAAIMGISEPSDGHPNEELTPDFSLFRPLSHNVATWVLYWPELTV